MTAATADVNVNGNGVYNTSFTPTAPGNYHWVAEYSGNSPNTNGVTHNAACTDTNEDVTVTSVPSSMTTAPTAPPTRCAASLPPIAASA